MPEVRAGIVMATADQLPGWGRDFACGAPDYVNFLFFPLIAQL